MGFLKSVPVCGQTYTRKIDYSIMSALSAISQSASKMCADIRLLAGFKELEEPFGVGQVGSSAMPYKRNPILCERVCGLARFVIEMPATLAHTQANQWLERSLDDSAVRRVVIPEAFIAADVILNTCVQICDGLVVWPAVIKRNLYAELPFMAAEVIIVSCVKAGESRQVIHEALRVHSAEAARRIKESGDDNILFELLAADPLFASVHNHFASFCDAKLFMGTAPKQVEDFMSDIVVPLLKEHAKDLDMCVIDV